MTDRLLTVDEVANLLGTPCAFRAASSRNAGSPS